MGRIGFKITRNQALVGGILVAEFALLSAAVLYAQSGSAGGVVVPPGAASIAVAGQTSGWNQIVISRVVMPMPGWVVVQEERASGEQGIVLAHAKVPAGESRDVRLTLVPTNTMPNSVVVVLAADRGKSDVFEYPSGLSAIRGGMAGAPAQAAGAGGSSTADVPLVSGGKVVALVVRESFRDAALNVTRLGASTQAAK